MGINFDGTGAGWQHADLHVFSAGPLSHDAESFRQPADLETESLLLTSSQRLTWRQLYRQFGVDPAKASDKRTVQNFRYKVLRKLKKIKLAWKDLNYTTAPGVLILLPSTPAIASLNQGQLPS